MKNYRFKNLLILSWTLCAFLIFFSSMKSQLILSENVKNITNIIFPQGWGFFTKNPQDFALNIYRIKNRKLEILNVNNQSLKNSFGFSRSARLIGYELSTIVSDIPNKVWVKNKTGDIYDNINDKTILINNRPYFNHIKKGDYLIKLYKPIPFAWANDNQEKFNPFSVVKIKIQ